MGLQALPTQTMLLPRSPGRDRWNFEILSQETKETKQCEILARAILVSLFVLILAPFSVAPGRWWLWTLLQRWVRPPLSPLQHLFVITIISSSAYFCHHHHLIFSTFLSPSTFLPSWSSPSPSHLKHRSTIKTIIKTTTSTTRGENHDLWIARHVGGVVSGDRLNLARRTPHSHVELLQQICHQVVKKVQCSPKPRGKYLFLLAMLSGTWPMV